MYGYIYKTTNLINNKFYVGKHKYPKNEIDPKYYGSGKRLREAIKKYGQENFVVEILDVCMTASEANEKEKYWIKKLDARNREIAYNISFGGDANVPYECLLEGSKKRKGIKFSNEVRMSISKALKGKPKSDEHKKQLSKNHHLKTTHIKYYKNGTYELTNESVENIAKSIGVTRSQLKRASEVGEFRCGDFYLLDLTNFSCAFDHQFRYSKEKCFFDPIKKDIVSHNTLRIRHQHHMDEYKDVNLYNYTQKKLEEKNAFIKHYTQLKENILQEETK